MKILRIDSSPRKEGSVSRQLADTLQKQLEENGHSVTGHRDVYYDELITLGDENRYNGYFTPVENQTEAQKEAIEASNILATEFAEADGYIIAAPMYNFSVSAGLKNYIDLIARAGITFNYLPTGPVGLLENKKAYVVLTTGGTPAGSEVDILTPYLKTFLGFLGITDVTFVNADLANVQLDESVAKAQEAITAL